MAKENMIFHPTGNEEQLSRDSFGYEPIQYLAKQLFALPAKSVFIQLPCAMDPRGYLDLYGEDPEAEYKIGDGDNDPFYQALSCFFDHISFILDGRYDCVINPDTSGTKLFIINSNDNSILAEQAIDTRDDLLRIVRNVVENQEVEES